MDRDTATIASTEGSLATKAPALLANLVAEIAQCTAQLIPRVVSGPQKYTGLSLEMSTFTE